MKAKLATFAAAVLVGTMAGFAGEEVKVGSPFDLKLGSEELAVRHPKLPSRSYSVFYDDPHLDAGRAWTNWYQQATVTFARPYHIFDRAELHFTEEDKKLYEYELHKDCPESMSREDCIKMMEAIVAELNAHYGLKLKLGRTSVDQRELKGRDVYSTSFAHIRSDFSAKSTNNVHASVYGMVNRKGGMSVGVNVTESVLASDVHMRRGRFFEGQKNGGKKEPFALPLGYNFGDVYTNRETVAAVPDCLTNWPARFGWDGRVVPIEGKWRDFDGAFFRLTEFGRISSFAAVLSTNGIASVEALEKWATDVLESRKGELDFDFFGELRFYPQLGESSNYRTSYLSRNGRGRVRPGVSSSVQAEIKRLDDGRAYLRISYSTDEAKNLDAPQRQFAAAGIRRALKELLELDFESETTNRTEGAWLSDWRWLDVPKGVFTEGRFGYEKEIGRLSSARLRRSYEGDVSKEELAKAVKELFRTIEAKAGQPLPLKDSMKSLTGVSEAARKVRAGEVLCHGDWFGGTFPTYEATAKVGDMSFEISYAVPQYVKDGDGYRPILKGGIVFTVSRETTGN